VAKVKFPLLSGDASGDFGKKMIFRRGGVVTRMFHPKNPRSAVQVAHRQAFKEYWMAGLTQAIADLLYSTINHLHESAYAALGHLHDDHYLQLDDVVTNGWIPAPGTWTFSSADAPVYVVSVNQDVTGILKAGMKFQGVQSSIVKNFFIQVVGNYSGGATLLTLYGGLDSTLASGAITSPFYSTARAPFGFPTSRDRWTVTMSDVTLRTKSSPSANTWYGLPVGSELNIVIPIGKWEVKFQAAIGQDFATTGYCSTYGCLSTSPTSKANNICDVYFYVGLVAIAVGQVGKTELLSLAAKTTYYPVLMTDVGSAASLHMFNSRSKLLIEAVCAYL